MNSKKVWITFRLATFGILAILAAPVEAQNDWSITFTATIPNVVDKGALVVGGNESSKSGLGQEEEFLPPPFPNRYVRVYTEHDRTEEGWEPQPKEKMKYRVDLGAPLTNKPCTMTVSFLTDRNGIGTLSWTPISDPVFENYDLILRDPIYGAGLDMKAWSSMSFYGIPGMVCRMQMEIVPKPPIEPDRWERVFDLSGSWRKMEGYEGIGDMNKDQAGDELDVILLYWLWRDF